MLAPLKGEGLGTGRLIHRGLRVPCKTPDDEDFLYFACSQVLIMDPATAAAHPQLQKQSTTLQPRPGFRTWTDGFSNLLEY
jgi:hypothetical protein